MQEALSFFDPPSLVDQIGSQIEDLPYPALEQLIVLVMRSMGYTEIRIVDGGKQRGRSNFGGMSLMARSKGPLDHSLTLVQVKQIRVQRRNVDELRGAMLRWGAGHGIIVTTKDIPDKARFSVALFPGRPVGLMPLRQLARLVISRNLGVRKAPVTMERSDDLIVDSIFFDALTESKP